MLALTLLSPSLLALCANASDWPRYLGPLGTNVSPEKGLLAPWPKEGPPRAWQIDVGPGFGGAAIAGDEVFFMDRAMSDADLLRVVSLEDGKERWSVRYEAPGRLNYEGSRAVPSVTDSHVFTVGGFGHVTAFDRAKKAQLWQVDLVKRYDADPPQWGWAQGPVLWKDLVIVAAMGKDVGVVALDAKTGEERWHTKSVGSSHSTPVLLEIHGVPQVLFLSVARLSAFHPEDGRELWWTDDYLNRIPIPPPVLLGGGKVLLSGGYDAGSVVMEVARDGDTWSAKELARWKRGSQIHPPIVHGGKLYFLANENSNDSRSKRSEGGLACTDFEGKEFWRTGDAPYFERGGMILADGHLLVQDGNSGELYQIEASSESYRQKAVFDPWKGAREAGKNWSPLALAHGRLVARTQEQLACFDLRTKKN